MSEPTGYLIPKDYVDPFFAVCDRERAHHFGGGPIQGPDYELKRDRRPAAVVCLLETLTSAKPAGGLVMERMVDRNIWEVIPTGITSEGHKDDFCLTVREGTSTRNVFIPFTASAEEFHSACGFSADIKVCLGGVETIDAAGTKGFSPFYRWRIMFPDDDAGVSSYSETGVIDAFSQCLVTRDQWFASERLVTANLFYPTPQWPAIAIYDSPAELQWQNDRWEIIREGDPREGEAFFFTWSKDDWAPNSQFTYGYWYGFGYGFGQGLGFALPTLDDDGKWFLKRNSSETVTNPPYDKWGYSAWMVWERGRWQRMVDSNTYRVFSIQTYAYAFGWGAQRWRDGQSGASEIQAGTICLLHWTGREWVMSETEKYNFRYAMDIAKAAT